MRYLPIKYKFFADTNQITYVVNIDKCAALKRNRPLQESQCV